MKKKQLILSRETIRLLDKITIETLDIPGLILMENAGMGAAQLILEKFRAGTWQAPLTVLCGTGNNGGDGFVIARHAANAGVDVETIIFGKAADIRNGSDAAVNLQALRASQQKVHETDTVTDGYAGMLNRAGCIVDAVFGTGLDRPVDTRFQELFETVNRTGAPVLAVDCPSGLDAETGKVLGAAIKAQATATFAAAKPGLFKEEGPAHAGEVTVVPISIPLYLINKAAEDEEKFMTSHS